MNAPSRTTKASSPHLSPYQKRRQRAHALAKRLDNLAKQFPEYAHLIQDPQLVLHHQSRRALVLHRIHTGAWTIEELTRETRLTRPEVQRILDELLHSQIIFSTTRKNESDEGGRPRLLYLPHPNSNP